MNKRLSVGRVGLRLIFLVVLLLALVCSNAVLAQAVPPDTPAGVADGNGAPHNVVAGDDGVAGQSPRAESSQGSRAESSQAPRTETSQGGLENDSSSAAAMGEKMGDSVVDGIKDSVQDTMKLVRKTFDKSTKKVKKVGTEIINTLTQDDADIYASKPCSFQIVDKLGRVVKTTKDSQLAFQMHPCENGRYLNGKREVEVEPITIDPNTWLMAEPVGDSGVFTVDLLVPVAEDSSVKVTYNVRFTGTGDLAANSLETNSIVLTHRGTEHDVEVLRLLQTVRQSWEWPVAWCCFFLTLALGWLRAASAKERVWKDLTQKRKTKADAEAAKKFRRIIFLTVAFVIIGLCVVAFFPGVQGFQGYFPYCGVWLGSIVPLLLVLLLG